MWRAGQRVREHSRTINHYDDALRYRFTTEGGQVRTFTVQYEAWIDDEFRPAIRYDTAHGQPHRDELDWSGETIEKEWLPAEMSLNEAMTYAERDILDNWPKYREAFVRRRP